MRSQTPASISNQDQLNKSVHKTLNGNVSPGNGLTFDTHSQPLKFNPDNMSGIIIRIGATANPFSLPAAWAAANTDLTFAHNLNKIPYGFIVIAKRGPCDVYWGSIDATSTNITLKTTDATVDTTIWLLA